MCRREQKGRKVEGKRRKDLYRERGGRRRVEIHFVDEGQYAAISSAYLVAFDLTLGQQGPTKNPRSQNPASHNPPAGESAPTNTAGNVCISTEWLRERGFVSEVSITLQSSMLEFRRFLDSLRGIFCANAGKKASNAS